jgi:hypothetical protein
MHSESLVRTIPDICVLYLYPNGIRLSVDPHVDINLNFEIAFGFVCKRSREENKVIV